MATITSSTWNGCYFSGQVIVMTPNHATPWTLWGTGSATTGTSDHVASRIGGVNMGVNILGGVCIFTVTGSLNATFDENNGVNQAIAINETAGNLTISGASLGCVGTFANGDLTDLVTNDPFVISGLAVPIYLS